MISIIHTPTPSKEKSISFYKNLHFKVISENPSSALVSDGKAFIELNENKFSRTGIRCYKQSWQAEAQQLSTLTSVHKIESGYALSDLNGVWIYLDEAHHDGLEKQTPYGMLGNYCGISIESFDINKSAQIWAIVGFEYISGSVDHGFMSLQDPSGQSIHLMKPFSCPHMFINPSLTYFNGKANAEIIAKVRATPTQIVEEITHFNKQGEVDNIIIKDPGNLGFFIFND